MGAELHWPLLMAATDREQRQLGVAVWLPLGCFETFSGQHVLATLLLVPAPEPKQAHR